MKVKRLISLLLTIAILSTVALSSVTAATNSDVATGAFVNHNKYAGQTYDGEDLGFTYTPEATTWKVWSPAAERVQVKLYSTGTDRENGAKVLGVHELSKSANFSTNGVWEVTLNGDYKNVYYTYLVTTANTHGKVETNETQDIYSRAVGANGDRSMVVDLDDTDPEGWDDDKHVVFDDITKTTVWELHIRDFSCDPDSGISEENRGDYLAFTEGGTTLKSDTSEEAVSTGIDYLVEQGINCVQLMPFADFDQVDEVTVTDDEKNTKRNWGYNPKNYNVPDGTYTSDAYDGNVRINEVKQMIQALHDRGISVIMDVVYNHTSGYEASCFTKTVPGYYYRMWSDVAYYDGSGQGCELASENQMVRNYIVQSLKYWAEEYHIDGFRFDLMACLDVTTMNEARTTLNNLYADGTGKKIAMYGEPWAAGDSGCTQMSNVSNRDKLLPGIGMFGEKMRNNATNIEKPSTDKDPTSGSWITTADTSMTAAVVEGITADTLSSTDNTRTVTYAECHDKYTLWDKITGGITTGGQGKDTVSDNPNKDSTNPEYIDTLKLAGALFMTSQGVVFFQAGTEFARTKNGQDNSYNSPDSINQLDWSRVPVYKESVEYFRGLNRIHEVYSPFSDDTKASGNTINFISNSGTLIAYTIDNVTKNKENEWGKVAVLLNSGTSAQTVNLGAEGWEVVANKTTAGVTSIETVAGSSYTVPARSAAILVETATYKDFSDNFKFGTLTTNHYVGEELVKTTTAKYRIGTKYHALTDKAILVNNNLVATEGTASGEFTGDTVVNFKYEDNGVKIGKLTVNYIHRDYATDVTNPNAKVTPSMEYTMAEGEEYNIPVCAVQGYQLDANLYPSGTTGKFTGEDTVINFIYKDLDSDVVTVHYKKPTNWRSVICYAYTDDGNEPLGAWNKSHKEAVQKKAIMEDEGNGWVKMEINNIASCKVMFYTLQGASGQEPGRNEPGYPVSGECWVEDKVVTYSATTVISHINVNTGKRVAYDVKTTAVKKSTEEYAVTYDDRLPTLGKLFNAPANASGFYQPGVTNIVYLFDGGVEREDNYEVEEETTAPDPDTYLSGDANCDGVVSISDVTYIQQYLVNLTMFDNYNKRGADVDIDFKATIKDASYIQKYLVGIKSNKIGRYLKIDSYIEPTPEAPFAGATALFSDNKNWASISGNLYCYCWNENEEYTAWPGTPMEFVQTNDYGEAQYEIKIPEGFDNFIINTGETGRQTANLKYTGQAGFYINNENTGECGTW